MSGSAGGLAAFRACGAEMGIMAMASTESATIVI
jgi:hypothetical protein